jgi:hypothetical protein
MARPDRDAADPRDALAKPDEPGAYVGRLPEREAETIPGGVRPDDERIAAHSTQTGDTTGTERAPRGHVEGPGRRG